MIFNDIKNMKKNKKNGFTLAEVLIALTVVGVVSVVLIGALGKIKPNKEKVLFRKAYNTTVRIVSEMINDEELYPDSTDLTDTSEVTYRGKTYSGDGKFCGLFKAKVGGVTGTTDNIAEVALGDSAADGYDDDFACYSANTLSVRAWIDKLSMVIGGYFTTNDGIAWSVPMFTSFGGKMDYMTILVDVNGLENGPNCADWPETIDDDTTGIQESINVGLGLECDDGSTYDRFLIIVDPHGKVFVLDDTKAQEYLSDTSVN